MRWQTALHCLHEYRKGWPHLGGHPPPAAGADRLKPFGSEKADWRQSPFWSSFSAVTPATLTAALASSVVMLWSSSSPPCGLHILSGLPGAPVCVWLSSPQPSPGRSSSVTRAGGGTRSALSSSWRWTLLLLCSSWCFWTFVLLLLCSSWFFWTVVLLLSSSR